MATREERPTAFGKNPPRVLVIEDDHANQALLQRILGRLGCIVVAARTGREARASASAGLWDVVFVDLGLPDVDGLELLPELVGLLRDPAPAFIVLSGHPVSADQVPADCAILTKPIRIQDLMLAAKIAVDTARARGQAGVRSPQSR